MSFFTLGSITPRPQRRARLTVNYFTVYVDTNMPGYDSAVRNAVRTMDTKSADWADDALLAMDRGYKWGFDWTDEKWHVEIVRESMYAGIYMIRVMTDNPHHWLPLARFLRNLINKRGLYLGNTYRRKYVRRISPYPPAMWPNQAINQFQLATVNRTPRNRRFYSS